jgi:hypothetical protein
MNFLKKIFQKKEETLNISFNELSPWLIKNIEFSPSQEIKEIQETKESLKNAIDNLEKTKIKDKAGKRIETAVKTNKNTYITALRAFESKINTPEKYTYSDLRAYISDFKDKIKNLNKRTLRNYHIIKTLIGEDLEQVAKKLRALDQAVNNLTDTIEKNKLKEIEEIHERLKELNETLLSNKEKSSKEVDLKKTKETLLKKEEKIRASIKLLEVSEEYNKYNELIQKRDENKNQINDLNSEFLSYYLAIERSIRKFLKDDKKTIEKLKQPQKFFLNHTEEFQKILKQIKENIESEKVVLKNPEKTRKQITDLLAFSNKYKPLIEKLKEELEKTETGLNQNKFKEKLSKETKELEDIEKKLTEKSSQIEETKQHSIEESIQIIEKNLKKLGHKIIIKNVALDR